MCMPWAADTENKLMPPDSSRGQLLIFKTMLVPWDTIDNKFTSPDSKGGQLLSDDDLASTLGPWLQGIHNLKLQHLPMHASVMQKKWEEYWDCG